MRSFINLERSIHSLKTVLACIIGFLIIRYIHLPFDQWIIITIIVVMCAHVNVGSMLQKSLMRFLGTILGSTIAISTLILFHHNPVGLAAGVGISVLIFSFIATSDVSWKDSGTLGAVTTAIILLTPNPNVHSAFIRCIEISLGIIIAALVSQFIFPIRARVHLRRSQANTVQKLWDYYKHGVMEGYDSTNEKNLVQIDEKIIVLLQAQRKLVQEAVQETWGQLNVRFFKKILWCEKEILRAIDYMHELNKNISPRGKEFLTEQLPLKQFNEMITQTFTCIISLINQKKEVKLTTPRIANFESLINKGYAHLNAEDFAKIASFLYLARLLTRWMRELAYLTKRM